MTPELFSEWDAWEAGKREVEEDMAWEAYERQLELESEWVETNNSGVQFLTPMDVGEDWAYWNMRFQTRQAEYQEAGVLPDHVHIRVPTTSTIAFIGDQHIGNPSTDYERIAKEAEAIIETPNMYAVVLGDTVDGYFWGGEAQYDQMEQTPEQYEYIHALIRILGEHGKLLAGFSGDHDGWAMGRGSDMIQQFIRESGGYYMRGMGKISLYVGQHRYNIVAAHRLPGHSIYNNVHPQRRAMNEGGRGADFVVSGHTHRKGIAVQAFAEWEGDRQVHMHSLGSYKRSDEYARKRGWGGHGDNMMGGTAAKFHEHEFFIEDFYDILEAAQNTW